MAKNEDGEFELVLGNRQLVSVFLIVVILLGAFFSMGYLVGRSTSSGTVAGTEPKPMVVEGAKPGNSAAESQGAAVPASKASSNVSAEPGNLAEGTKPSPVKSDVKERGSAPASKKAAEIAKSEEPTAHEDAFRKPPAAPSSDEPRSGTFLQVVATSRPDAEIVAESLAKKGFRTTIAPGPAEAVFRVLVGPVRDASDLGETRTRLESAGFKPYVRKY